MLGFEIPIPSPSKATRIDFLQAFRVNETISVVGYQVDWVLVCGALSSRQDGNQNRDKPLSKSCLLQVARFDFTVEAFMQAFREMQGLAESVEKEKEEKGKVFSLVDKSET